MAFLHCPQPLQASPAEPLAVDYQMIGIMPDFLICLLWVTS